MIESIISLITATSLLLGSPGPAPLALAATGATYGIKNGIPFLLGILSGLAIAIIGATVGIAALFSAFPNIKLIVQVAGVLYIVYVAQKIARAPALCSSGKTSGTSPAFIDGFILNLLNPKAYAAFLAIFSQFLLPLQTDLLSYVTTAIICFIVAVFVDVAWLVLGGVLRPFFESPKSARILRLTFAVLMVVAVVFSLVPRK
ncbi:MAG: LysE family translocator [Gammaproteobacteria bacterium]|nr:LysE family translocator [Gammaproteobacteria bacterium]